MSQREADALWRRYVKAVHQGDRVSQLTLVTRLARINYRHRP